MSKVFYDHFIILEEVETEIKTIAQTPEEKEELWHIIDEIVHHKVLVCILDRLPFEHHHDFLTKFYQAPHDESLLSYLNERIEGDIEEFIKEDIKSLEREILEEINIK